MRLSSARLMLRPLGLDDWRALADIGRQPQVARMLPSLCHPWQEADIKAWIMRYQWTGALGFRLAICLPDGALIGTVGLYGHPTGLAYFLAPAVWGQGYAFEASTCLLVDAIPRFQMQRIVSGVFQDNPASIKVLEKLGFTRIGTGTGYVPARHAEVPSYSYEWCQAL